MKKMILRILAICMLLIPAFAYAADLNIASIADIQANCQYYPNSYTYYCTEPLNWGPSGSASVQGTDGQVSIEYPPGTTYAQNSLSGVFTGANPLTITAGGNCAPKDAKVEITGVCEGSNYKSGDCTKLPDVTSNFGYFQRHEIDGGWCAYRLCSYDCNSGASFNKVPLLPEESCSVHGEGDSYWSFDCCYVSNCKRTSGACTATSYINQENLPANCNGQARTYYTPCTYNPTATVNGMFHQYLGGIKDTATVTLPLYNFKPGANTISFSSAESGKFNYKLIWTEVNSSTGSCTSSGSTKAYHMASGSAYQSGDGAKIVNASFDMKFDAASTDTTIALLKDDTNAIISVRIYQYDGSNLKIEIPGYGVLSNNIQPDKWYAVRIILNEVSNTLNVDIMNFEYPTISKTYATPAGLQAVKWISVASNGMWMDNINIVKKNAGGAIISTYVDDFESYNISDSVLYSNQGAISNIYITSDIGVDTYNDYSVKNLVLKAKNNLEAKSIFMDGIGCGGASPKSCDYGTTGYLEMQGGNKVKFNNLRASCPNVGEPQDTNCGAGSTKIKGGAITGNSIEAYGGQDCSNNIGGCSSWICQGRGGGSTYIEGTSANIATINMLGGGSGYYAAGGGSATILSDDVNIQYINTYGPDGWRGGSGGPVTVKGKKLNINQIDAHGGVATSDPYCFDGTGGQGGSVTLMGKETMSVSTVLANGGNGYRAGAGGSIRFSAKNIIAPVNLQANGAMGRVGTFGRNSYVEGTGASPGGSVRLYFDSTQSSVSVSAKGGNADCINTGGMGYCALSNAGTGGLVTIFSDAAISESISVDNTGGNGKSCKSNERPDCYKDSGPSGNLLKQKRTWSGFAGINASLYDTSFNAYRVKVKDPWGGQYVMERNSTNVYEYTHGIYKEISASGKITNKIVALITKTAPFYEIQLGRDYVFEITASVCRPFDEISCSHSGDKIYLLPFVQY